MKIYKFTDQDGDQLRGGVGDHTVVLGSLKYCPAALGPKDILELITWLTAAHHTLTKNDDPDIGYVGGHQVDTRYP